MPSCPPLFTNFKNTFETNIGECFDGFWYYPSNQVTNPLTQLSVPPNVAYDYNRNCITVDGTPVLPDCTGFYGSLSEFCSGCITSTSLTGQTGYAYDVPDSGNAFYDPTPCPNGARVYSYISAYALNRETICDSQGRALWVVVSAYC